MNGISFQTIHHALPHLIDGHRMLRCGACSFKGPSALRNLPRFICQGRPENSSASSRSRLCQAELFLIHISPRCGYSPSTDREDIKDPQIPGCVDHSHTHNFICLCLQSFNGLLHHGSPRIRCCRRPRWSGWLCLCSSWPRRQG